jgi:hypothetical protein
MIQGTTAQTVEFNPQLFSSRVYIDILLIILNIGPFSVQELEEIIYKKEQKTGKLKSLKTTKCLILEAKKVSQ